MCLAPDAARCGSSVDCGHFNATMKWCSDAWSACASGADSASNMASLTGSSGLHTADQKLHSDENTSVASGDKQEASALTTVRNKASTRIVYLYRPQLGATRSYGHAP